MIYLISDLHNSISPGLLEYERIAEPTDLLIILGDIGLYFPEIPNYADFAREFLRLKKPIAFLDGNHENFEYLDSLPVEDWNGGKVHRLTDSIVHLMRGNIYTVQGKSFFVMGGSASSNVWKERKLWDAREVPSAEEIEYGYSSLSSRQNRVDYILTHTYQLDALNETASDRMLKEMNRFLDERVSFTRWYCGHWHVEKKLDERHQFIYRNLHVLE